MKSCHRAIRPTNVWGRAMVALLGIISLPGNANASEQGVVESVPGGARPFVILIGAPGAGKSSNGISISKQFGIPVVNMGDVVAKEVERASTRSVAGSRGGSARARSRAQRSTKMKNALERLKAGELVSDETFNAIVASRILQENSRNGFVLDGYPGSVAQAEFLDTLLDTVEFEPLTVIYLDIPDEVALERMQDRNRDDDKQGFGEERLRQFRANIAPILDYYKDEGLFTVDGTKPLYEVTREVNAIIEKQL